ncbi:uncharacterized protein LOC114828208 [Galendromus occidentalis]|uniref:Uncharacterized protein LOC114828208 n=1 Tax=Galendromus occidentalis TaxID=34638 RepID=A0AAJ7SFL4_9ACAR|nr:uncharacterized protein LOC114828208 [Galendromus occidentalis]
MKPVYLPYQAVFNSTMPHLRVAMVQVEPYINMRRLGDEIEIRGPFSQIAEAIQKLTRNSLSVVSIEDVQHGHRLKNGSFVGIMGKFERDEVDLLVSPAIMNEERFILADPSIFEVTSYTLLGWSPRKVVDPFNFASAFTAEVWLSVLLSFLLLSLICWIMDRYLTPWEEGAPTALSEYAWDLFTRFFPQDAPLQDASWFRMCLIGFLIAFSLILMTFLSSALTSSMTIKRNEDFVNSYADVLRFPKVRIYSEKGTIFSQIFLDPHNALFRKLSGRHIPVRGIFKLSSEVSVMVDEIEAKTRVIVGSPDICKSVVIKKRESSGRCPNVMLSTESAGLMLGSLFVSRRLPSATREIINRAILVSLEAFLYRKTMIWSMDEYEKCRLRSRASLETTALSVLDVQGCFVLFAIGVCAATTSLCIEISRKRSCRCA